MLVLEGHRLRRIHRVLSTALSAFCLLFGYFYGKLLFDTVKACSCVLMVSDEGGYYLAVDPSLIWPSLAPFLPLILLFVGMVVLSLICTAFAYRKEQKPRLFRILYGVMSLCALLSVVYWAILLVASPELIRLRFPSCEYMQWRYFDLFGWLPGDGINLFALFPFLEKVYTGAKYVYLLIPAVFSGTLCLLWAGVRQRKPVPVRKA